MSEEINTQAARRTNKSLLGLWNIMPMTFPLPKRKWTLEFPWLYLGVGLSVDCIPSFTYSGKRGQSSTEPIGKCGPSFWAPKGNSFCDVPLRGAFHVTFARILWMNPWFYFSSRYCLSYLFVMGKWKLIAAKRIIYNLKIFGCEGMSTL